MDVRVIVGPLNDSVKVIVGDVDPAGLALLKEVARRIEIEAMTMMMAVEVVEGS